MPHSSGGGSSSSGGHSGSSSSSHSSSSSSSSYSSSSSSSDSYSRSGNSGSANLFESTYFEGARCFVYYCERKPVFIYSKDDPYEMGKGKIVLIVFGLLLIIASFFSFDKGSSVSNLGIMHFACGLVSLMASGSIPRFGPKELAEIKINKANPKTESCPHCGRTIVSNIHEICPHCGEELELNPFAEDETGKQQADCLIKNVSEENGDNVNPATETLMLRDSSITPDSLKNGTDNKEESTSDSVDTNKTQNRQTDLSYMDFFDDRDYRRYVPGLKRYVYYKHKQPIYFFSKLKPKELVTRSNRPKWWLLLFLPFIALALTLADKYMIFAVAAASCLAAYLILTRSVLGREKLSHLTEVDNPRKEPDIAICPKCGGYFVNGIHQKCPHCKTKIESTAQLKVLSAEEYRKLPLPPQKHTGFIRRRKLESLYFKGATCYVYYKYKRPYYVYSNVDLGHGDTNPWLSYRIAKQAVALILIFTVFLNYGKVFDPVTQPLEPKETYNVLFCDKTDVLNDNQETALLQTLREFQETTGVPVAFFTENNSTWRSEYPNMIDYAYDVYVNHFNDEYHWVLIYSQSQNGDVDHPSWYWEGMQGDYTDQVLDVFLEDFNKQVQSQLEAGESVFDVFNNSFTTAADTFTNQKPIFNPTKATVPLAMIAIALLLILWSLTSPGYRFKKLIAVGETEEPETEHCPHCGNVIVSNVHKKCPDCRCDLEQKTAITKQQ